MAIVNKYNPAPIASPCISQCCLDEKDVCVGCFRHIDEITGWHGADDVRRQQILTNCLQRKNLKAQKQNKD